MPLVHTRLWPWYLANTGRNSSWGTTQHPRHLPLGLHSPFKIPSFSGIRWVKTFLKTNSSMKCSDWYSQHVMNAQGSRLIIIIVVVQLGAVKIYVTAVEVVLRKNLERRQDEETPFTAKIDGFLSFIPHVEC